MSRLAVLESLESRTLLTASHPPAAPTDLKVTASSSSAVTLQWVDQSSNESGFKIYRSSDGVTFSLLNEVGSNTTTYVNGKLTKGKHYYYRVRSFNSKGDSKFTHTAEGITGVSSGSSLSTPTNFQASASSSTAVTLTWANNVTATSGYQIQRSLDGANFSVLNTVGPGVTSYVNGKLTMGATYWYRICGLAGATSSAFTGAMSATPGVISTPPDVVGTPGNVMVTVVSSTSLKVSWSDNSNNETGFKIDRSTDGKTWSQVATTGANTTSYTDTGLTASTKYWYRLRAYNDSATSGYSHSNSAITSSAALIAPNNVITAALSDSSVRITWTGNSPTETGFDVERSTDQKTFVQAGVVTAPTSTFVDTNLESNTKYYYRVRAFDASNTFSPYSNVVGRTTLSSNGSSDHSWANGGTGQNATGIWDFDGVTITLAADPSTVIPILKELHVGSVRTYFTLGGPTWNATGGSDGLAAAKAYHDAGFKVLMQIGGATVPTGTQATDYYNYVVSKGVLPYVDEFEIGNEPNIYGNWDGTAQQYVDDELAPAWNVLHPLGATVVGAGPSWDVTYAQTLVKDGYLNYCDIADFHPYGDSPQQILQRAQGAIAAYQGKPTIFTEWTIRNHNGVDDWSSLNTQTRALLATVGAQQAFYFPLVVSTTMGGAGGLINLPDYSPNDPFFSMYKSWGDPVS